MKGKGSERDTARRLGAERVLEPAGALPQRAERLDPSVPCGPFELEVAVERLCLDSTSFREIRERSGGDAGSMAARILEITATRGKMHNPETDSGGILTGTVAAVGERYRDPPEVGQLVATLGSLTLTPLRLGSVDRLDPASPQVEVSGTAYVCDRAAWAPVPDDIPLERAVEIFDVCAAATQTRDLAPAVGTVCVLGAGHAGRLALAAARDAMDGGTLIAVDSDPDAVERVLSLGLCDIAVAADLRDPLAALTTVQEAGGPPADLTVVVVNARRCEPSAFLLTADDGTILFFSMATSFSAAALAADGIGSSARMMIGSGFTADRGAYALELVRGSETLRSAMGLAKEGVA
jgi:L-erythro-3,5-diaminohexanoate dehydrogenase